MAAIVYDVSDTEDDDIEVVQCSQGSQADKWRAIPISSSSSEDEFPVVKFTSKVRAASSDRAVSQQLCANGNACDSSSISSTSMTPVLASREAVGKNDNFTAIVPKSPRKRKAASDLSRQEKAAKKAYEQALKGVEKANKEASKPAECMKSLTAFVDPRLLDSLENNGDLLSYLQTCGVVYQIESQPVSRCVQWRREVSEYYVGEDSKVSVRKSVLNEPEALVVIPARDFATLSISTFCEELKEKLPDKNICLIVYGVEQYFNRRKSKDSRDFRKRVRGQNSQTTDTRNDEPYFDRDMYECKKVELLLEYRWSVWPAENSEELAKTVAHFTKSIAEKQFKEMNGKQHFRFYAQECTVGSVKVTKEGIGLSKLWQKQLEQFPLAGMETAQAITAVYPTPLSLVKV